MPRDPSDTSSESPDPARVYDAMEPLTPYTTAELAEELSLPRQLTRRLLKLLAREEKIEEKTPATASSPSIWIREPQQVQCPKCKRVFKIQPVHPILGSVKFCPDCGTQLRK